MRNIIAKIKPDAIYKAQEIAKLLGVTTQTINMWIMKYNLQNTKLSRLSNTYIEGQFIVDLLKKREAEKKLRENESEKLKDAYYSRKLEYQKKYYKNNKNKWKKAAE